MPIKRLFAYLYLCCCASISVAASPTEEAMCQQILIGEMTQASMMAKSACLLMTGDDKGRHAKAAVKAAGKLETGFDRLLSGNAETGLPALPDGSMRSALQQIQVASDGMTASTRQLAARDYHTVVTNVLLQTDQALQDSLGDLASRLPVRGPANDAAAIRVAQMQNVRVQQIVRDLCYAWLGIGRFELLADIETRTVAFDQAAAALLDGNAQAGIRPAADLKVKIRLAKVQGQFDRIRPTLEMAIADGPLDIADIRQASVLAGSIARDMAKVVEALIKE